MKFKEKDIVKVSGIGRTKTWGDNLRGTVKEVDTETNSVFVIWHGTCVEDEMSVEELIKVGENTEIPPTWKIFKKNETVLVEA